MLQLTYTITYTITTITTMYYYFYYKILNSVEKKFRKAAHMCGSKDETGGLI